MNLIRKSTLLMSFVVLLVAIQFAASHSPVAKVRGKVVRRGNTGVYPVPYVRVTLTPSGTKEISQSVYTGSDGMFYFNGVRYGNYAVDVWNVQNQSIKNVPVRVNKVNVVVRDVMIP